MLLPSNGTAPGTDLPTVVLAPLVSTITTASATITNNISDRNGIANITFYLYSDAVGLTFVSSNTSGIFPGLSQGTQYWTKTSAEVKNGYPPITWEYIESPLVSFTTAIYSAATPDAFTFIDALNNVPMNTVMISGPITVTGISAATYISVVNGQYSINGGSWTSADGIVNNLDTVRVSNISGGTFFAVTNTLLTIGGITDTYTTIVNW